MFSHRQRLRSLFDAAVASAKPENCMPSWLPRKPPGRVLVVGAGKAAASMAGELEKAWSGPLQGHVIVPYGHALDCQQIKISEAAHPLPDNAGIAASRDILQSVSGLGADDTVVCLLSGGGSSLLSVPIAGISLADKQSVCRQLLRSGAAIHEINAVRKKLSAIKGGRLAAAAAPASVMTLIISDVAGNDAATVASGPTIADDGSPAEALEILERYGVDLSSNVRTAIAAAHPLELDEGDIRILASSDDAMLAAAALAVEQGVTPLSLGDQVGDARELARQHAKLALQIAAGNGPVQTPCVVLSGGETTVTVRGNGRGGRNSEYALALAIALQGQSSVHAIACDTDGIDGVTDSAGCFVAPDTLQRAAACGIETRSIQQDNNSYELFAAIGDLVVTGPTLTNVNDFRAILISSAPAL